MAGSAVNLTPMLSQMARTLSQPVSLSQGQQGLFGELGRSLAPMPEVNPQDPISLRAAAEEAQRRGDSQAAQNYATMAQNLERVEAVKRDEARMLDERKANTRLISEQSDNMLAGIIGQEKLAKAQKIQAEKLAQKEQAQVESFAKAAATRVGPENAAILKTLDMKSAVSAYKEMAKDKDRKTKIIERVDADGNTRNVMIDEESGDDIRDLGIKSPALSAKDAAKAEVDAKKRDQKAKNYINSAQNVLDRVTEARELVKDGTLTTGLGGQILSGVGGTDARNLQAKLTTIKANLGFDRLQEMRDASPTGGALGQVAIQELVALQAAVDSLDQAQSEKQLLESLNTIEKHYTRWMKTMGGEMPEQDDPLGIRQ